MGPYILLADDEDALRYALRAYLTSLDYEVAEAANGLEALKSISQRKPDLLILDVVMTPVTGWDVLKALHNNPSTRDIRVLMLTALGRDEHETYGWFLGCDWYQVKCKPLDWDDLGLVVERLLAVDPVQERNALMDRADEKDGVDE